MFKDLGYDDELLDNYSFVQAKNLASDCVKGNCEIWCWASCWAACFLGTEPTPSS